ncbi:MAG: SDR family NAD(P)-dependent oxidoreductase [Rhodospirillales bacterium]
MIRLDNQVAIVTGAGRGMGRTHALLLASRGARVVVNDYGGDTTTLHPGTIDTAQSVADEIIEAGGEAVADATMIGTGVAAGAVVDRALSAFGRIDILVNNAGGALIGDIDAFTDDEIEGVLRTNLIGPYMLMRRVWPHMRAQSYGRIVNIMSSATLGIGNIAAYASGKAGLIGLTAEAAIDGRAHNILVNGIFPTGASRLTEKSQPDAALWYRTYFQPEKVSAMVGYLCSRELQTTGDIYNVGAGRVARLAMFDNDGMFDPDITPESIGAHIEQIRDLAQVSMITSSWQQTERFFSVAPWTGGTATIL